MVGLDDAVRITEELIRRSAAAGEPMAPTIVFVGGTAMAAHRVRALSNDVDFFVRRCPVDKVLELENEERARHGPLFRLDVTTTENIWGRIVVRDIEEDATNLVKRLEVGGATYELRAIGLETLFLLKLGAGRQKDRDDLTLLAARISPEALVARFNRIVDWYGDRHALLGFADAFVDALTHLCGVDAAIIDRLNLPESLRSMLWDVRRES